MSAMVGVKQSVRGRYGDCTRACLATLLGVPLEDVFDPAPLWGEGLVIEGHLALNWWLEAAHGLRLVQVSAEMVGDWRPDGYWIATTMEQRDGEPCGHATVWHGDQFRWNPEPGYDGPPLGPLVAVNYLTEAE